MLKKRKPEGHRVVYFFEVFFFPLHTLRFCVCFHIPCNMCKRVSSPHHNQLEMEAMFRIIPKSIQLSHPIMQIFCSLKRTQFSLTICLSCLKVQQCIMHALQQLMIKRYYISAGHYCTAIFFCTQDFQESDIKSRKKESRFT